MFPNPELVFSFYFSIPGFPTTGILDWIILGSGEPSCIFEDVLAISLASTHQMLVASSPVVRIKNVSRSHPIFHAEELNHSCENHCSIPFTTNLIQESLLLCLLIRSLLAVHLKCICCKATHASQKLLAQLCAKLYKQSTILLKFHQATSSVTKFMFRSLSEVWLIRSKCSCWLGIGLQKAWNYERLGKAYSKSSAMSTRLNLSLHLGIQHTKKTQTSWTEKKTQAPQDICHGTASELLRDQLNDTAFCWHLRCQYTLSPYAE